MCKVARLGVVFFCSSRMLSWEFLWICKLHDQVIFSVHGCFRGDFCGYASCMIRLWFLFFVSLLVPVSSRDVCEPYHAEEFLVSMCQQRVLIESLGRV